MISTPEHLNKTKKTFEDLSIFQRLQFLHDLHQRVRFLLPKARNLFLGQETSSDEELLRENEFYRTLCFSIHADNQNLLRGVYYKLNPSQNINLPPRLRCHSIIILLFVHLFNQYHPILPPEKILHLVRIALSRLKVLNEIENERLEEIFEYYPDHKTLLFTFQEKRYHCQLNTSNGYGYELTLLKEKQEPAKKRRFNSHTQ